MSVDLLDLFAGAGGVDLGARWLGLEALGVECDLAACATREAAGFATIKADIAALDPLAVAPGTRALWASPPCPSFSAAGKRVGLTHDREHLDAAMRRLERGERDPALWAELTEQCEDKRSGLLLEPLRCVLALDETLELIAFEQVPLVLPFWRRMAAWLGGFARPYHVWTGVLNAADYGVPQTRYRAFLVASRRARIGPPAPTHSRHGGRRSLFGDGDWTRPWVSMAEALAWDGALRTNRDWRPDGSSQSVSVESPVPAVTGGARSQWELRWGQNQRKGGLQTRAGDEPAPSVTASSLEHVCGNRAPRWCYDRPATTVQGDPRIGRPGHKSREPGGEPQFAEDSIRVTVEEVSVLQGFPPDFPWRGSRTARFRQCGNAVPPPLAAHVLGAPFGLTAEDVANRLARATGGETSSHE